MLIAMFGMLGHVTAQAGNTYCCDVGSQPVCSDILQPVCYGRAYREITPGGTVVRQVAAPLTPEEIAAREAEKVRLRIAEEAIRKQQQMDRALLGAYPNLNAINERRDREVADIDQRLVELRSQEQNLVGQRKSMEGEFGVLSGKPLTPEQDKAMRDLNGDISMVRTMIDAKVRERGEIVARFAEERRRYIELTTPKAEAPSRR
jgi:hypothetical protein